MKTRFISTLAIVLLLVSASKAELVTNSIVVDELEYSIQADKDTYNLGENVVFWVKNRLHCVAATFYPGSCQKFSPVSTS